MDLSSIEHYDVKPLKGFDDKFRLRIGKYRIIFTLKEEILMIEVIKTGGRGNVYK